MVINPKVQKINILRELLRIYEAEAIPVEILIKQGFPASAAYPSYWYGAQPGARLAYDMGLKASFSRKFMTLSFEPMCAEEKETAEARFAHARQRYVERTAAIVQHIRSYVSSVDEELDEDVDDG